MVVSKSLGRLVQANVRLSRWTQRQFCLQSDKPLWQEFERRAASRIRSLPDEATVVDLGGGRRCVYAGAVQPPGRVNLVAVDISQEELSQNRDVSDTRVADVCQGLPFAPGSVDLILSRVMLEHVANVGAAAQNMGRVLKPGGVAMHLVPGRYSLFGTAARVLPFGLLLHLVHWAIPETVGQVEFEVVYDRCHPRGLSQAFHDAGFADVQIELTWAQPGYFEPVYPFFLLHTLYEWVTRSLRLRQLAAYMIVTATR